jgi:hypothetical protein
MSADSGLDIGRRVKARRLADALRSLGGTAADARRLSDGDWINAVKLAAQQTGRGFPKRGEPWRVPSEVTRALVIEYLARPEAPAVDPGEPRDEDVPPE